MGINLSGSFFRDVYNRVYLSVDSMTKSKERNKIVDDHISNLIAGLKLFQVELNPQEQRELRVRFVKKMTTETLEENVSGKTGSTSSLPTPMTIRKTLRALGIKSLSKLVYEKTKGAILTLPDNPISLKTAPGFQAYKDRIRQQFEGSGSDKDVAIVKVFLENQKVKELAEEIDKDMAEGGITVRDLADKIMSTYKPKMDRILRSTNKGGSYAGDDMRNLATALFLSQKNNVFDGCLEQLYEAIEKKQEEGRITELSLMENYIISGLITYSPNLLGEGQK